MKWAGCGYERATESLTIAEHKAKAKIDNKQENSKCRFCDDRWNC